METEHRIAEAFVDVYPEDAVRVLERFECAEVAAFVGATAPRLAAGLLRKMTPQFAAACLSRLERGHAAAAMEEIAADLGAALLRRVDPEVREGILSTMHPQRSGALRRLAAYAEGTAASLVDPNVFVLPDDITVAESISRVREARGGVLYYLYVVSREHRLVGVLNIRELMLASPETSIGSLMRRDLTVLLAETPVAEVLASPEWRKFMAVPVVESSGVLVGVIRLETLQHLRVEADRASEPHRPGPLLSVAEAYWQGLFDVLDALLVRHGAATKDPERTSGENS